MHETKVTVFLIGDITYDSRVKRISDYISSKYKNTYLVSLNRDIFGELATSDFNHHLSEHKIIRLVSERLPLGKPWGYIKYFETLIRFFLYGFSSHILYCNDLNSLVIGYAIKIFRPSTRIIYDSHELAPYQGATSNFKIRLRYLLERTLIKKANYVLTVSEKIAVWYRRTYKLKNISAVMNAPLTSNKKILGLSNKPADQISIFNNFVWHGIFGNHRGIEIVLDTFSQLPDLNITFYGWGDLKAMIELYAGQHRNIRLKPPLPQHELINELSNYDAGLFTYMSRSKNYDWALPNKFFEYSAGALPIISFPLSQAKSTLSHYQMGLVCKNFDKDSLSSQLSYFSKIEDFEINHYRLGVGKFLSDNSWTVQKEKLDKVLLEIDR